MKDLLVSCIAVSLSLGVVSATENATICPNNAAVPLLRAYIGQPYWNHLYTTNEAEMQRAVAVYHFTEEGHAGLVFAFQAPGTVPFYRTYSSAYEDFFYTTDLIERANAIDNLGYTDYGITGYIYPTEMCGSIPFHRLFIGAPQWDHFYTTDVREVASAAGLGYKYEGIAGYILPN